ncbi:LrgB family protein [Halalkalibacter krulwichiae]|uniref:Inner membrane protein YohK n=1 Tax=Halalkalibacter krulwichiae TaxID=199441 RepID=A0A1X9MJG5_9BACI|nr:LrgB family protein [Halalkalibacter krulwichiae]ARK31771.1 Inner membrane protein YohK [Halalkalibacter krulwichiae]
MIIGVIAILITVLVYIGSRAFYRRFSYPFTLPLLVGTIILITIMLLLEIPYETYYIGGRWLELLLGPAVVALAYPLYRQLDLLKKYFFPIVISVSVGAIVGIISGLMLARIVGVQEEFIFSLVPKSVTTPVAMDVALIMGGIPPLAAVLVMVAGIGGVVMAPYIYKWIKVKDEIGRGIGTGCASHAIGTAKALESSEKEGATSSVAMTLSAVIVSLIGPMIVYLFI